MENQKVKTEKTMLGFEVALKDLGKKTRFPSKLDTSKLKLDVGCGSFPQGDVNCDLHLNEPEHSGTYGKIITPKHYPNFVRCDVQHLPFRDDAFSKVVCRHVIEHVDDPCLLFRELVRVSSDRVLIQCPFWLGDRLTGKNPFHKSFFNATWFRRMANKCRVFHNVYYSRYLGVPHMFIPLLQFPLEITVKLRKECTQ